MSGAAAWLPLDWSSICPCRPSDDPERSIDRRGSFTCAYIPNLFVNWVITYLECAQVTPNPPNLPAYERLWIMLKVLIAEDDLMIADMSEDVLVEQGYEVCGIGRTVAQAVTLGRRHLPDLAIIDMRLADGGRGSEVAAQLVDLERLGILYVTGNISSVDPENSRGHGCLAKPYLFSDLVRGLEIVSELIDTGKASPPFPGGFKLLHQATADPLDAAHG